MRRISRRLFLFGAWGLVAAGVPLAGHWLRRDAAARCETDGVRIDPRYQVRAVDAAGGSHRFCSPRCARRWLASQADPPAAVYVTDDGGGGEIDARQAHFVHSPAVTDPVTGNHVRAFRDLAAAEAHVRAFGGWVLDPAEDPFRASGVPVE